jgi:hypothetical protein
MTHEEVLLLAACVLRAAGAGAQQAIVDARELDGIVRMAAAGTTNAAHHHSPDPNARPYIKDPKGNVVTSMPGGLTEPERDVQRSTARGETGHVPGAPLATRKDDGL